MRSEAEVDRPVAVHADVTDPSLAHWMVKPTELALECGALERDGRAGASVPFVCTSVRYVGVSDGRTDLADNFQMDWTYDTADDGTIALTAEIAPRGTGDFSLGRGLR